MKRVALALLGLFLAAHICSAQNRQARIQRETAIQELQAEGLSAAHATIPLQTKVKLTNPANGLEIEVTVIEKLPSDFQQIIDLSPGAALALDIGLGGPVIVTAPPQPLPTQIKPESAELLSLAEAADSEKVPFHITINNYVSNQEKSAEEGQERPVRQNRSPRDSLEEIPEFAPAAADPAPPVLGEAAIPSPQPPAPPVVEKPVVAQTPPEQTPAPPAKEPLFTAPPVNNIQIIPGLPNPHDGKIYRLLVGTYPGVDSAFRVYQQLQAAGFAVVQEQAGEMCRVFAAGIPASRLYYAAQRLGAIGFQQVWVHE